MIFLLLILVLTTNILTLYVIFRINSNNMFDKVCRYVVVMLLFHSAYALLARFYFAELSFVDRGGTFGLLYGPMLYFIAFSNNEKRLDRKNAIWHLSPFLLATGCYIIFLCYPVLRQQYRMLYFGILYSVKVVSMLIYVFYIFMNEKRITSDSRIRNLINSSATWLLLIACLYASIVVSRMLRQDNIGSLFQSGIVYGAMLFMSLLIFKYYIDGNVVHHTKVFERGNTTVSHSISKNYQKSTLTVEALQEYERKLNDMMQKEQLFLDTELSLKSLSKKTKIPKHHLTQLFNTKMNQPFYQYINRYRINYSCGLLFGEPDTNLEEIAFRSGFNSKVTFNRYFKNQLKCTPSEYRQL